MIASSRLVQFCMGRSKTRWGDLKGWKPKREGGMESNDDRCRYREGVSLLYFLKDFFQLHFSTFHGWNLAREGENKGEQMQEAQFVLVFNEWTRFDFALFRVFFLFCYFCTLSHKRLLFKKIKARYKVSKAYCQVSKRQVVRTRVSASSVRPRKIVVELGFYTALISQRLFPFVIDVSPDFDFSSWQKYTRKMWKSKMARLKKPPESNMI